MKGGGEQPHQLFTVEEANQRLPLVKVIVKDIVTLFTDLHDRKERLTELRNRSEQSEYRDEVESMESELQADIVTLDTFVAELADLGVELKDPVTGGQSAACGRWRSISVSQRGHGPSSVTRSINFS